MKKENDTVYGYWLKKDNNPFCMSRKEFEDSNEQRKFSSYPYEFYRVFPILNHSQQQKLLIFVRTNCNPVDIIKECARLLEEKDIK